MRLKLGQIAGFARSHPIASVLHARLQLLLLQKLHSVLPVCVA